MICRSAATWLHQAPLIGQHDKLYPVPDPEFHEYPPDVSLDGGLAEVQLVAYGSEHPVGSNRRGGWSRA